MLVALGVPQEVRAHGEMPSGGLARFPFSQRKFTYETPKDVAERRLVSLLRSRLPKLFTAFWHTQKPERELIGDADNSLDRVVLIENALYENVGPRCPPLRVQLRTRAQIASRDARYGRWNRWSYLGRAGTLGVLKHFGSFGGGNKCV
jgi:hypothetical protein